jgi:hypothetical protein
MFGTSESFRLLWLLRSRRACGGAGFASPPVLRPSWFPSDIVICLWNLALPACSADMGLRLRFIMVVLFVRRFDAWRFFMRWDGFFPPAFRRHYRSHSRRHYRSGCRSAFYLGLRRFCSRYHNSRTRLTASKHAMSFDFSF